MKNPPAKTAVCMKRVPFLLLLAILVCSGVRGQVRLGLLGGIHSASIQETNQIPGWDTTVKKYQSSRSGVQIGVIVEIPIGHSGLFFQPALLYTSKGRRYTKYNDSATVAHTDTVYKKQTLDLDYIDIPLNFTYKLPLSRNKKNNFFISAGPYVSFFYNGKLSGETLTKSTNKYSNGSDRLSVGSGADTYKTFDLGVNGRAGFELGNVMLSGYFSRGLTSFYNAPYQGTFHHQLVGASLGIWLTSTASAAPPPPKDTDKDGIPDREDLCPLKPGTQKWHGCPVPDTDRDGVDDEHDSCRNQAGLARYNGCPIPDSDHDGINDEEDKCPLQAGVGRYQGCPIPDRDGDGVNDEEDKCPDQAGTADNHGCPLIKQEEVVEKIKYTARNILFNSGSDRLTESSNAPLDELAGLLQTHPEWHLTIEGYTDNQGDREKNILLSRKRAQAVVAWLVKKGIPANHLTARGYGPEHPLQDNATPEGRTANRRVELKVNTEK